MSALLFLFGRTPQLSWYELSSRIPVKAIRCAEDVARVETSLPPDELMEQLGGTVKIARELGRVKTLTAQTIMPFFRGTPETFGISVYGDTRPVSVNLLHEIKKRFEERGAHTRYVLSTDAALSSVVVAKQKVHELVAVKTEDGYTLAQTVAVQDVEAWGRRDYGRPFADPRRGMLPPKVARMVVNIAGRGGGATLFDPFCGVGTILGEAMLTGWRVIGSDQSAEVIEKARKNLEFLRGTAVRLRTAAPYELFVSDATHVSEHVPAHSVDAIVTEPYLGPASIEEEKANNIIKGLEKLYRGCLRDWQHVVKPHGKVVIALPEYVLHGRTYSVKSVLDSCENLGYTVSLGPLTYSRPQAIVRRKFFVLQKRS